VNYLVNGKLVDHNGNPAEPLEEMTAQEVLDAVDSGEVSKADALAAEKKRSAPRKTVTEGL